MVDVEARTRQEAQEESAAINRAAEPMPARIALMRALRIFPLMITLAAVAVAGALGWAMWDVYMGAPWTRDGTVRVYVVTMAPQVAGQIVELPIKDNQFVHKGDLLLVSTRPTTGLPSASTRQPCSRPRPMRRMPRGSRRDGN